MGKKYLLFGCGPFKYVMFVGDFKDVMIRKRKKVPKIPSY